MMKFGGEECMTAEDFLSQNFQNKTVTTKTSGDFATHADWFQNVITENVVLCHTSALEILGMFNGFMDESKIDVYSLSKGQYNNIHYHIVDTFDNIAIVEKFGVRCTTFEQTINDMLNDIYNADEWALTEALSDYYFTHNKSFNGLNILPENQMAFENIMQSAIEYYRGG